jgi:hypothetical protein
MTLIGGGAKPEEAATGSTGTGVPRAGVGTDDEVGASAMNAHTSECGVCCAD